jgi:hypothetical protein
VASSKTDWILDIKTPNAGPGADLPNGPFPGRAFVPSNKDYQGEIIVWVESGHLSGLNMLGLLTSHLPFGHGQRNLK